MPQLSTESNYRPDIDGLRAVSIVSVVLYHAFPDLLPGGFVGVDIFFVISGYLITSIILGANPARQFTLRGFYRRRIQRILPALILTLVFCLAAGWFILLPLEYASLGKHSAAAAVFIPNFVFWSEAGYFDEESVRKPLLHLWSLGVEEQFYIFWPLILIATTRMRQSPALITLAILLTSFTLSIAYQTHHASAFFLPQFRMWEILLGAAISALHLQTKTSVGRSSLTNAALATTGLMLMCLATLVISRDKAFPGWWALLPAVGAAMVIASSPAGWLNRRLLGNAGMVFIGKISYPLYLWHWPLLSLTRIIEAGEPAPGTRLTVVALSVLLAWLTYVCIEKRLRYHPAKAVPYILVASLFSLGLLGLAIWKNQGIPSRTAQLNPILDQFVWHELGYFKLLKCPASHPREKYCRDDGKKAEIAVLGDSHAGNVFVALMHQYQNSDIGVVRLEQPNCPPLYDVSNVKANGAENCLEANNGNIDWVAQNPDIHTVYLSSMGPLYLVDDSSRYQFAYREQSGLNSNKEVFAAGLRASVKRLLQVGKTVVIVIDWPGLSFHPRQCFDLRPVRLTAFQPKSCEMPRAQHDKESAEYKRILLSLAAEFPSLKYWDTPAMLCDQQVCHALHEDLVLYRDPGHLTIGGSKYLGAHLQLTPASEILKISRE
jgi:peptidoglycan/LPS O-acetylase OafA/YrhL